MPKRSAQDKLESYRKKIRKIEEKEQRKKEREKCSRRFRRQLDSSDDENNGDTNIVEPQDVSQPDPPIPQNEVTHVAQEPGPQAQEVTLSEHVTTETISETSLEVILDSELLSALGASTSNTPEFGDNIHESLASLWNPILKKGLPKEDKDKLFKEYLLPGNCKMLQAPKLNAEIFAAVSDVVRGHDRKLVRFQQQLGVGTAAISTGINTLLTSGDKVKTLKQLSDGCRFLTDLHHVLSKDRIKLVTPSLEKNFLTVIQDAERDDTLFGNSLSEKIKASQAINKQSSQIKAPTNQKTASGAGPTQMSAARPVQGNWPGPSRYQSNRGGRGGQRKPPASTPRRAFPQTQSHARTSNQSRMRAPPH